MDWFFEKIILLYLILLCVLIWYFRFLFPAFNNDCSLHVFFSFT